MRMTARCCAALLALCLPLFAAGAVPPVGERHGVAHTPSAAVRDADHRDNVRYTVWYPAQPDAQETALTGGRRCRHRQRTLAGPAALARQRGQCPDDGLVRHRDGAGRIRGDRS